MIESFFYIGIVLLIIGIVGWIATVGANDQHGLQLLGVGSPEFHLILPFTLSSTILSNSMTESPRAAISRRRLSLES